MDAEKSQQQIRQFGFNAPSNSGSVATAASEHIRLFSFNTNFIGDENAHDIFVAEFARGCETIKQKEFF
jgi:hypothetical protein